jgi:hypothetical protein
MILKKNFEKKESGGGKQFCPVHWTTCILDMKSLKIGSCYFSLLFIYIYRNIGTKSI